MPAWLQPLALAGLGLGLLCAAAITVDLFRRPQRMAVMNPVWPINALYLGPVALWAYGTVGREQPAAAHDYRTMDHAAEGPPTWRQVFKGTMHCGAGCTLGAPKPTMWPCSRAKTAPTPFSRRTWSAAASPAGPWRRGPAWRRRCAPTAHPASAAQTVAGWGLLARGKCMTCCKPKAAGSQVGGNMPELCTTEGFVATLPRRALCKSRGCALPPRSRCQGRRPASG